MAFLTPSRLAPQGISGFQLVGTVRSWFRGLDARKVALVAGEVADTTEIDCAATNLPREVTK
jgi:hypothetical protein